MKMFFEIFGKCAVLMVSVSIIIYLANIAKLGWGHLDGQNLFGIVTLLILKVSS